MNNTIPPEIKKWIEDEAEKYTANRLTKDKFIYGATKMYQHLQENGRVAELEKEVERLKGLVKTQWEKRIAIKYNMVVLHDDKINDWWQDYKTENNL